MRKTWLNGLLKKSNVNETILHIKMLKHTEYVKLQFYNSTVSQLYITFEHKRENIALISPK